MRKILAFTAAWVAAAAVAVVVAWQGVGIVTTQVTDDRPAALAAGDVRALTEEARAADAGAGVPTTTAAAPAGATPDTTPPAVAPPDPGTTATASPRATPAGPTTTAPAAPPTNAAATPTTAAPADAPAETRTYNLVGGSVALRFAPSGVTVVWATPAAGFEVEVEPEHGNGVRVEFDSDDHRSRVTGWWDGGPLDETREDEG